MSLENKKSEELKKEHIPKEKFQFVQKDEKIFDKKFETKPIGYFKDAMTRFAKNRTNVYATIIMFTLILLSILVPITTDKRYAGEAHEQRFLPPRVPYVENLGFMDGMVDIEAQRVDLSTIDEETGLGLPSNDEFNHDFIDMSTLENYSESCSSSQEYCLGGYNDLRLSQGDFDAAVIHSHENFGVNPAENPTLFVDIESIRAESDFELNLYFDNPADTLGEYNLLTSIDSEGEHEIDIVDELGNVPSFFSSSLKIELVTDDSDVRISFESIELHDDTQEDPVIAHSGHELSKYTAQNNDTNYNRRDGEILYAKFEYDKYEEVFGEQRVNAMGANQYNRLLQENADVCEREPHPDDPDNDEMGVFSEGCPITEVLGQSEPLEYEGEEFFTYEVMVDYAIMNGYEETPYFFFGTDPSGRDLFALSWVALRTSLFIAVAVNIVNISFGVLYGAIEGYYGGKTDLLMERFSEVIGRIPWLVTLSIFVALLGSSITTLMFILIFSGWIGISSITRTQFYRYKRREYVLASRTLGAKDSRLIFRHILPNGIGTIITTSILSIPLVIFAESTISYLGFGIGHGVSFNVFGVEFSGVSIGVLLADSRIHMNARPYLTVFPAIIIALLMITFNMFGNALRDAFNPSLRGTDE